MSRGRLTDSAFLLAAVFLVLVFLPPAAGGEELFLPEGLGDGTVLAIGALSKLAFLLLAFLAASANVRRFERSNPARLPWLLLAAGLGVYGLGQAVLVYYQLVLAVPVPFPSVADPFFVLSMILLFSALVAFLRAFRMAGYLGISSGRLALRATVATVALGAAAIWALAPVASVAAPPTERLLNLLYPALDVLLLVPTVLLVAAAWRFVGGRLAWLWGSLLLGFLLLAAGDVLFAYFSAMEWSGLDPVVDLLFVGAYLLIARGTLYQAELLSA